MDRYQKVQKPKPESPVNENEIRITSQGLVRNYLTYASTLLQDRQVKEIVLKAMGQAINKTVAIAEILKRRVPQLHQDTAISSVSITDTFEPIEEGLQIVEQTRHVSMISITLSNKELNQNSPGYQGPSNADHQTKQQYSNYKPQQQHQPPRRALANYNAGNGDTYGRGRGRGRGRGQGWHSGGYSNYQENGGYSGGYNGGYSNSGGYNGGYSNSGGYNGGYSNSENGGYSGGYNGGYSNPGGYSGGYNGGYSNPGGYSGRYSNWGRGGSRGGWGGGYRGAVSGRGRGGGGRGYGSRGRGGMGGRATPRGGGNQA